MDSGSQYIEAAFITREVGARYQNVLDRLSEKIGWPIRVREAANQAEVAKVARQVTPEGCTVRGEPRFFPGESRVVVPVVEMPLEGVEEVREAFLEATGFEIGWEAR